MKEGQEVEILLPDQIVVTPQQQYQQLVGAEPPSDSLEVVARGNEALARNELLYYSEGVSQAEQGEGVAACAQLQVDPLGQSQQLLGQHHQHHHLVSLLQVPSVVLLQHSFVLRYKLYLLVKAVLALVPSQHCSYLFLTQDAQLPHYFRQLQPALQEQTFPEIGQAPLRRQPNRVVLSAELLLGAGRR